MSRSVIPESIITTVGFCPRWCLSGLLLWLFSSVSRGDLLQQAISKLDSSSFLEREVGQSKLLDWGRLDPDAAKIELFERSRTDKHPEVRARCFAVLRELLMDDYSKEGSGYIGIELSGEMMKVPRDLRLRSVIRVNQVQPSTPASRAGILVGDFIIGLNRGIWYDVDAYVSFLGTIKALKPNTKVFLQILRNGVILEVPVTLMRRPSAFSAPFFLNSAAVDVEGSERAAKEAYFRQWLHERSDQN